MTNTATHRAASKRIYRFKHGIPGFENLTGFAIDELVDYPPFKVLRSIDEPSIAILVLEVQYLVDVRITIPVAELDKMGIDRASADNVRVYAILKYNRPAQKFTANIKAPIVVDGSRMIGEQVILDDPALSVEHTVLMTDETFSQSS